MYEIDRSLLERIDALKLSERNIAWRKAMKAAPWRVYVDRERLTVQSWRETEGEDLEIRIAKMLKKVMDNVPIRIHPFDEIVGRLPTASPARFRGRQAAYKGRSPVSPGSGLFSFPSPQR